MAEFLKFFGQVVVVIVGWFVVNQLAVKREQDKARRELVGKSIDDLCKSGLDVLEKARTYHTTNRDLGLEFKIKYELQDFSMHICHLQKVVNDKKVIADCLEKVVKLRQSITRHHFEDEHNGPLSPTSPYLDDLAVAHLAIKDCLVTIKYSHFS